ncbi:IclR family transcriptional regulator [Amycolatopsis anabasis]|uniref:IclR family transcriptional regulator n=1 Tax=Amycolatopsis anabasis TaxID=1840409 RepID=UPI001FE67CE0|nr:IclR family transcriptional regulator [Amycolatopsis anabasis]
MQNYPYLVESVDNALRLLLMLQRNPELRLSEAADELGVARSTVHRLLATLRHRGFVTQGEDKLYHPGPALCRFGVPRRSHGELKDAARPHLRWLNKQVGETVHLMVRTGREVRFLDSIEGAQALRVGSRIGVTLPAHLTSGGKALLADLPPAELGELLRADHEGPPIADADRLLRELDAVRRRGFGLNNGESEPGLTAVGMCLRDNENRAVAALAVSAPSVRFRRGHIPATLDLLKTAVQRTRSDLAW